MIARWCCPTRLALAKWSSLEIWSIRFTKTTENCYLKIINKQCACLYPRIISYNWCRLDDVWLCRLLTAVPLVDQLNACKARLQHHTVGADGHVDAQDVDAKHQVRSVFAARCLADLDDNFSQREAAEQLAGVGRGARARQRETDAVSATGRPTQTARRGL